MNTIPLKGGSLSKTYIVPHQNIVRKEVSRKQNREYGFMRWYSQLMKLQRYNSLYPGLFPKVLDVGANSDTAWFDIEYFQNFRDIKTILSQDDLTEDQIFNISSAVWKGLDTIHSHSSEIAKGCPKLYYREEVEQKIMDSVRIQSFEDFFYNGTHEFDKEIVTGIAGYLYDLENYFREIEDTEGHNIHGNPTLENILYSFEENRVIFIDVYDESMWNTKYLDYSQVLQCSRSHYGYINDKGVRVVGYGVSNPNPVPENFEIFNKHFISNLPEDKMQLIDILEATQFIRMLPFKLLAGDVDKAKYFYVHACRLLRKVMK